MQSITLSEKQQIIQIRLLIARTAQEDSLKWWEDNSLSPAGAYLLDRAFVFAPEEASRKLALLTAKARYQAAFENEPDALHLFRLELSGAVEYGFREVDLMKLTLPEAPVLSLANLKRQLAGLTGGAPNYRIVAERADHRLEIRLTGENTQASPLRLAQVFALASLEGKPGAPLFPYLPSHR